MDLFFNIAGYEFKKILCRKRTAIVLALVLLLGALSVFGTIVGNTYYPGEDGERAVSRYDEEMLERQYAKALSGRTIDADLIMEAVEAYKKVPIGKYSQYFYTEEYQQYARKYSEIYTLVSGILHLDMEGFQNLTRAQAEQFDEIRRAQRAYAIESSAVSSRLKTYWRKCLEQSPETLTYEYFGGYYRFITIMYTTAMISGAALAILFSSIFSEEYTSGADALILSTKHGRGLISGAKLFVVFSVSAALIVVLLLISFAESMLIWGSGGQNASIEILRDIFPYPVTIGQCALLYSVSIFMACILFSAITALLSALFKTPFNTIVIMAVLLIVPLFLDISGAPIWLYNLYTLLPTSMMAFWYVMGDYPFNLPGMVLPNYIVLPVFAAAVTCLCAYFAYRTFRKHQIG